MRKILNLTTLLAFGLAPFGAVRSRQFSGALYSKMRIFSETNNVHPQFVPHIGLIKKGNNNKLLSINDHSNKTFYSPNFNTQKNQEAEVIPVKKNGFKLADYLHGGRSIFLNFRFGKNPSEGFGSFIVNPSRNLSIPNLATNLGNAETANQTIVNQSPTVIEISASLPISNRKNITEQLYSDTNPLMLSSTHDFKIVPSSRIKPEVNTELLQISQIPSIEIPHSNVHSADSIDRVLTFSLNCDFGSGLCEVWISISEKQLEEFANYFSKASKNIDSSEIPITYFNATNAEENISATPLMLTDGNDFQLMPISNNVSGVDMKAQMQIMNLLSQLMKAFEANGQLDLIFNTKSESFSSSPFLAIEDGSAAEPKVLPIQPIFEFRVPNRENQTVATIRSEQPTPTFQSKQPTVPVLALEWLPLNPQQPTSIDHNISSPIQEIRLQKAFGPTTANIDPMLPSVVADVYKAPSQVEAPEGLAVVQAKEPNDNNSTDQSLQEEVCMSDEIDASDKLPKQISEVNEEEDEQDSHSSSQNIATTDLKPKRIRRIDGDIYYAYNPWDSNKTEDNQSEAPQEENQRPADRQIPPVIQKKRRKKKADAIENVATENREATSDQAEQYQIWSFGWFRMQLARILNYGKSVLTPVFNATKNLVNLS